MSEQAEHSNGACSWPEQDAIDKWWAKHSFELKEAVTAYRVKVQMAAPARSSEKALREALTSLDVIENTLDEMKEWDTGHPNKAVATALFELRSIRALLTPSPAKEATK